ncbi:MAG: SCO family protein [Acidobacteriia bacterium]|nr:SCO family protein [Terriglobia bacterium]
MTDKMARLFLLGGLVLLPPGWVRALSAATDAPLQEDDLQYSCPMHPEVRSKSPGACPKCGMEFVRRSDAARVENGPVDSKKEKPADTHPHLQIPDTAVLDQEGRPIRFYSDLVKGRTVAINFLFTTCTTICPPMAAMFRKVQTELGDRVGGDIALISVTVDPNTDVPERLKGFLAKFKAGPGWTFVTGKKPEIDSLLRSLGAYVSDKNDHSPMILIGNEATGYWTRTYGLASPASIVKLIKEAAEGRTAREVDSGQTPPEPSRTLHERGDKDGPASIPRPSPPAIRNGNGLQGAQSRTLEKDTASRSVAAAHYFTNLPLLTQENKPVRFYEDMLKGKIVLVNFMFTTCTGICPPMTANLVRVQTLLGEHAGREINMLSLTVDPLTDTPEMLKKYADSFKIKPGWYFLTGKKENIDWVLYRLGGYVEDKVEHSGLLLIGNDTTGEWIKVSAMARPADIAEAVMKWLENKPKAEPKLAP